MHWEEKEEKNRMKENCAVVENFRVWEIPKIYEVKKFGEKQKEIDNTALGNLQVSWFSQMMTTRKQDREGLVPQNQWRRLERNNHWSQKRENFPNPLRGSFLDWSRKQRKQTQENKKIFTLSLSLVHIHTLVFDFCSVSIHKKSRREM